VNTSDIDFFCIASPQPAPAKKGGCTVGATGGAGPQAWILAGVLGLGAVRRRKRRR
jgi:MYXO-CTERM domain-containing protein